MINAKRNSVYVRIINEMWLCDAQTKFSISSYSMREFVSLLSLFSTLSYRTETCINVKIQNYNVFKCKNSKFSEWRLVING
jgi:hypothetical protein